MGIFANFSILNQRGTPAFFADAFANRPSPGFVGRIFIDTNVPTTGIYRDTGTTWEIIAGGIPVTPTLQAVTDAGNTTTNNVIMESRAIVGGVATNNIHRFIVRDSGVFTNQADSLVAERTHTYNAGTTFINGPSYSSIGGYDVLNLAASIIYPNGVSAASGVYSGVTIRPAGFNITQTQGAGIRALSAFRSQLTFEQSSLTNSTISHFAHFFATAIFKTNNSNPVTITNNYGLAISDQTEVSNGLTLTNRFGVAQFGVNDRNFFLGRVGIGTSVDAGFQLDVNGASAFRNEMRSFFLLTNANTPTVHILNINGIQTTDAITRSAINFSVLSSAGIIFGARGINATLTNNSCGTFFTTNAAFSIGHVANSDSGTAEVTGFAVRTNGQGTNGSISYTWWAGNSPFFWQSIHNDGTFANLRLYNRTGSIFYVRDRDTTNITFGSFTHYPSAQVAIDSTARGFLPPRMTTAQRDAIASPAAGLMIYNTTTNRHQGYNGTTWNDFF